MKDYIMIDTKKYEFKDNEQNYLIYQYCYSKGVELPCFCYNENLEIAGNCRICLVEIEKMPKLMLACATKVGKNMIIKTKNKRLERVRKSIMEFLLINHPLDCPICDQGGECDLQNIARDFGYDRGRFYEFKKRSVIDKEGGIFIKTIMTRCIHCTRCVRFFKEITGVVGFGIIGRGESTEIVSNKFNLLNVLSGNVVDLCPVGALTSKIYNFKGRAWELNKYENIDILDTMCSSICLDLRNNEILRILPVSDSLLNQDWITNITRYFFDALILNRVLKPFLILNKIFLELSWLNVTKIIIKKIISYLVNNKKKGIIFFLTDYIDLESLYYLKKFNLNLGYLNINLLKNIYNNFDFNLNFFFNSELNNLKNYFLYFFLVLNLRLKMPLLNTILRKNLKKKTIKIFTIGFLSKDISLNVFNLGNNLLQLINILENKSSLNYSHYYISFFFSSFITYNSLFKNYIDIALLVGENFFFFKNSFKLLLNCFQLLNIKYKDIYILFTNVIDLNYQELHLKNNKNYNYMDKFIYSFTFDILKKKKKRSFTILQNSFFLQDITQFNLIVPTVSFFEYSGLYLNFEGRLRQKLKVYSFKNVQLKSNLEILKYLNIVLKKSFSFNIFNFNIIKYFSNLIDLNYNFFIKFYNINFIIILKNSNIQFFYNYLLLYDNINFYDILVNIYHYKDLYKVSPILNKVTKSLNNYLNILNAGELI